MKSFSPKIIIDGETVTPKGYEWVIVFALKGVKWAIDEASKPEFFERIMADRIKVELNYSNTEIARLEARIKEIKESIEGLK